MASATSQDYLILFMDGATQHYDDDGYALCCSFVIWILVVIKSLDVTFVANRCSSVRPAMSPPADTCDLKYISRYRMQANMGLTSTSRPDQSNQAPIELNTRTSQGGGPQR